VTCSVQASSYSANSLASVQVRVNGATIASGAAIADTSTQVVQHRNTVWAYNTAATNLWTLFATTDDTTPQTVTAFFQVFRFSNAAGQ
jgi:hypothetical protein